MIDVGHFCFCNPLCRAVDSQRVRDRLSSLSNMSGLGLSLRAAGLLVLFVLAAPGSLRGQEVPRYVGPDVCTKCHASVHQQWGESLHSKILQPATRSSVLGDFGAGKIALHDSKYSIQFRNGKYYIAESDLTGKPEEHVIQYTLGSRRVQHYLTTLPDGRIVVLPPTWDVLRKTWVSSDEIENPEESAGVQVWNKSCYSCHVSGEQKNFDLEHDRYATTWRDLSIDCESCHGPGSEHVETASAKALDAETRAKIKQTIVNPARLDATRSSMICAQCHSFRDMYADKFQAGANYYDFFLPVMQYRLPAEDSAYWADGRPRWVSNETFGLWQSQCFLKGGATCTTCHTSGHNIDIAGNPQLAPSSNSLCAQCHAQIVNDVQAHSHHDPKGRGASCVECHMPRVVISLRAEMRDHSMSIPIPENTIQHNVPNACNLCHKDKDANWALQQVHAWYGDKSRQHLIRRADAFSSAGNGDAAAIPGLLQVLSDSSEPPLVRANAAGYLGSFPNDPSAYQAVLHALKDSQPLVRASAATAIRPRAAQRAEIAPALVALLRDPVKNVEVRAAMALVLMGVRQLPGQDGEWFENAKKLYRARAEIDSDDAQQRLAAGRFFYLSGDMEAAAAAFRATLKLDNTVAAKYFLARTLADKGDRSGAVSVLKTIEPNDPQYAAAQQLLAALELKARESEGSVNASPASTNKEADARFQEGQSLYQDGNYGGALSALEVAIKLASQAVWARKAQTYRAICLEKLARFTEAETAMQEVEQFPENKTDLDLQLAFVELLYESGRSENALKKIDTVIADIPKAPAAYFWRAKLLLQLQRPEEAAKAAEESIRLLPDAPAAHNLLIRIYQMQGRTAEAAQQAEWVRKYEQGVQSQ